MTEKQKRTGFRWIFETAEGNLAACPICGETEIQRKDEFRDALPVTRSRAVRIYFKCGHVFNGIAEPEGLSITEILEASGPVEVEIRNFRNMLKDLLGQYGDYICIKK